PTAARVLCTLSLHDALPISPLAASPSGALPLPLGPRRAGVPDSAPDRRPGLRGVAVAAAALAGPALRGADRAGRRGLDRVAGAGAGRAAARPAHGGRPDPAVLHGRRGRPGLRAGPRPDGRGPPPPGPGLHRPGPVGQPAGRGRGVHLGPAPADGGHRAAAAMTAAVTAGREAGCSHRNRLGSTSSSSITRGRPSSPSTRSTRA